MSEHLYRDEVGAAVERLTQLEEENARLRAELAQLTAPKHACVRPSRGSAVLMVFLAAALTGSGLAVRTPAHVGQGSCPHARRARTIAPQRHPTPQAADGFQGIRGGNDCSIPYAYDSNGVRRAKAACVVPSRK